MTKIKSILAFAAVLLCGGAWAKTVAYWDGNLAAGTQGAFTMAVDTANASFSEGKAVLTSSTNQARQGLKITWSEGALPSANVAAFVKYSGYSYPSGNHVLFSVNYDGNKDVVVYAKGDGSGVHCDFSATTGANGTRPGGDVKMPFTFPAAGLMYVELNSTTKNMMFYVAEKTESGYGPFKLAFDYYLKNGSTELSATKLSGVRIGGSIVSGGAYYRPAMTVEAVAIMDSPLPFKAVYTADNSNYLSSTGITLSPNATLTDLSKAFFRAQMNGSSVDNKDGWMTAYNTTVEATKISNQFQMLEGSYVKANIAEYTTSGNKVQVKATAAKYNSTSNIGSDCSSGWNGGTLGGNGYGVKNVTAYVPFENVAFVQGTKNLSELTCLVGANPTTAEQSAFVSIADGATLTIDTADFVGTYIVGGAKISAADGVVKVDLKANVDGVELNKVDFGSQTVKVYDGTTEITVPTTTWGSDTPPSSYPALSRDANSPTFVFASDTINLANIANKDYLVKGTMKGSWISGKPEATVSVLRDYVAGSDILAMQVQVFDGDQGAQFTKCQNITFKQATVQGVNYLFATAEKGFYIEEQGKDYRGEKVTPDTPNYNPAAGSNTPYEAIKLTVTLNEDVMAKIGSTTYKTLELAVEAANQSATPVEIDVVNAECMEAVEIGSLVTIKMNSEGKTIGAITGSGKVVFDGILPGYAQRSAFSGNSWTGTVEIKNCTTGFDTTYIDPGSLANANSDLVLDGVAGYIYTDGNTYPHLNCRNLTIGDGGITTKGTFSSGMTKLSFTKLLGSGIITMEVVHSGSGYGFFCLIGDASEFDGGVTFNNANAHEVVFAGSEAELPTANQSNYTAKNVRVTKGATIKYASDKYTSAAGWKIDGVLDLASGTEVEDGMTIISSTTATTGISANVSVAGVVKPFVLEVSESNIIAATPVASVTADGKAHYFKALDAAIDVALGRPIKLHKDATGPAGCYMINANGHTFSVGTGLSEIHWTRSGEGVLYKVTTTADTTVGQKRVESNKYDTITAFSGATATDVNALFIPATTTMPKGSKVTIQSIGLSYRNSGYPESITLAGTASTSMASTGSNNIRVGANNGNVRWVRYQFADVEVTVGEEIAITGGSFDAQFTSVAETATTALRKTSFKDSQSLIYEIQYTITSLLTPLNPGATTEPQTTEPTPEELAEYAPVPVNDDAAAAGQADIIKVVSKKINDTQWVITVDLDESKMPEGKKIDDSALAFAIAGLDVIAGSAEGQEISIPATAVTPGAYYSVIYGDSPTSLSSEGDRSLATSEGVTITVPAMSGKKVQFFRVKASAYPTTK